MVTGGEEYARDSRSEAIASLVSAAAQAQIREVMVIHQNQQRVVEFKEPFSSASVTNQHE